jgi:hypothetical protein
MMDIFNSKNRVPRANAENRAEVSVRSGFPHTIANPEQEENFAAIYIARRYRLSPSLARAVAALSGLGVFA